MPTAVIRVTNPRSYMVVCQTANSTGYLLSQEVIISEANLKDAEKIRIIISRLQHQLLVAFITAARFPILEQQRNI